MGHFLKQVQFTAAKPNPTSSHFQPRNDYVQNIGDFPGGPVVKNPPATLWLRICLPMQGTRVRALVREDPTCRGATKPVSHNY